MQWQQHAACRDADPELFFPRETTGEDHDAQIQAATAYCTICEVRINCLVAALTGRETGVWGGTTDDQRRHMRLDVGPLAASLEQVSARRRAT